MIDLGPVALYAAGSVVSAVVIAAIPKAVARIRAARAPKVEAYQEPLEAPKAPLSHVLVLDLAENREVRLPLSYPFVEPHHGEIESTFRPIPRTSIHDNEHGEVEAEADTSRILDDGSHPILAKTRQYEPDPKKKGWVNLLPGATVPMFAGTVADLARDPARFGFAPGEPLRYWGLSQGVSHLRGQALFELLRMEA